MDLASKMVGYSALIHEVTENVSSERKAFKVESTGVFSAAVGAEDLRNARALMAQREVENEKKWRQMHEVATSMYDSCVQSLSKEQVDLEKSIKDAQDELLIATNEVAKLSAAVRGPDQPQGGAIVMDLCNDGDDPEAVVTDNDCIWGPNVLDVVPASEHSVMCSFIVHVLDTPGESRFGWSNSKRCLVYEHHQVKPYARKQVSKRVKTVHGAGALTVVSVSTVASEVEDDHSNDDSGSEYVDPNAKKRARSGKLLPRREIKVFVDPLTKPPCSAIQFRANPTQDAASADAASAGPAVVYSDAACLLTTDYECVICRVKLTMLDLQGDCPECSTEGFQDLRLCATCKPQHTTHFDTIMTRDDAWEIIIPISQRLNMFFEQCCQVSFQSGRLIEMLSEIPHVLLSPKTVLQQANKKKVVACGKVNATMHLWFPDEIALIAKGVPTYNKMIAGAEKILADLSRQKRAAAAAKKPHSPVGGAECKEGK